VSLDVDVSTSGVRSPVSAERLAAAARAVLRAEKVRDALAALDVTVFFGQIKFDSRGVNVTKPMVVEQIQSGVHHTVFPTNVADAQPKYPTPS